jgi:lipoprotein-releasing system permease protein
LLVLKIAWRYFWSKKSTNAINIIAWIGVTAIAIGAAALIVVLSVFNGFEELVKGLYSDFYTDIKIVPIRGKVLRLTEEQIKKIQSLKDVNSVSFSVEEKAVLVNGDFQSIIQLKAVDENYVKTVNISKHIVAGKFDLGSSENPLLVIGAGIENAIGIDVEKNVFPLTVYLPNQNANFTGLQSLNSYNVNTAGAFLLQQEFDNKYAFTNLAFLKYMLDLKSNEFSSIEIKLQKNINPIKIKNELSKLLGDEFLIQTLYEQNKSLFSIMQMEKWVIYALLTLILIISSFNIIGALTMLILEKKKDIALLQSLGAHKTLVQKIFTTNGLLIVVIGGVIGTILSLSFVFLQLKYKLIKLSTGSFVVDYYPVKILFSDIVLVLATIFLIGIFASWLPAKKAAEENITLRS